MGRLPKLGFSTLDRRPPVRHHPLMSSSKLVKVLSIDGGGIRGYLPAVFLAEVERRAARPISGLFDLVVGTSTGGIIGLGLAAGKNAAELAEFYPMYGRRIFGGVDNRSEWDKRLWGSGGNIMQSVNLAAKRIGGPFGGNALFGGNARHTAEGLESALKEVFGEMKLSEVPTELAITTFDRLTSSPCVLSSRDARLDSSYDLLVREVARATSAAPTYFPPAKLAWAGQAREFIDGGVWANNPAGVAVNESIAITARRGLQGSAVLLVSLGTGSHPRRIRTRGDSILAGLRPRSHRFGHECWGGRTPRSASSRKCPVPAVPSRRLARGGRNERSIGRAAQGATGSGRRPGGSRVSRHRCPDRGPFRLSEHSVTEGTLQQSRAGRMSSVPGVAIEHPSNLDVSWGW